MTILGGGTPAAAGAGPEALASLKAQASVALPAEYLAQLALRNGGDGPLAINPGWYSLWPAEEVLELNATYEITKHLPGFFAIGSNGGGELLAFDARAGEPYPVVSIPFVPMDPNDAVLVSPSFAAFRNMMDVERE